MKKTFKASSKLGNLRAKACELQLKVASKRHHRQKQAGRDALFFSVLYNTERSTAIGQENELSFVTDHAILALLVHDQRNLLASIRGYGGRIY